MIYRTQTYIAGDWTGDSDLIEKLQEWNKSDYYNLHFSDVHEKMQARDTSYACSIKKSLSARLDMSKTFVFIVGKKTDNLTKGSCQYCKDYLSRFNLCLNGMNLSFKSFIQFEYEKAIRDNIRIIVLYNYSTIYREKCPEPLKNRGIHIPAYYYAQDGKCYWNYRAIKDAINNVA